MKAIDALLTLGFPVDSPFEGAYPNAVLINSLAHSSIGTPPPSLLAMLVATKIKIEKSKCKIMESRKAGQDYPMNFCFAKIHSTILIFDIYILHFSRSERSEERRL